MVSGSLGSEWSWGGVLWEFWAWVCFIADGAIFDESIVDKLYSEYRRMLRKKIKIFKNPGF